MDESIKCSSDQSRRSVSSQRLALEAPTNHANGFERKDLQTLMLRFGKQILKILSWESDR